MLEAQICMVEVLQKGDRMARDLWSASYRKECRPLEGHGRFGKGKRQGKGYLCI